ncbi:Tetra-spanning protein 1 [Zancudomyces culisetae]|uniref:Tetra-spanning protein 1 n=1 Tax=Zancudomyces culisetae TaxID=1213189 RepID=A0A1R1PMT0_ZANCU|nr:Tetra-spanning protein 1 [Zancudomyces culisetae]|eukprot:OMH82286.1 Tetra-spanning protein 1 [Zancudomyces culisetae]
MSANRTPRDEIKARFIELSKGPQFYWWLGHVATFVFGTLFHLKALLDPSSASKHYHRALLGSMISYGISIYKTYGAPQFNLQFLQRVMADENVQYSVLATTFYLRPSILDSNTRYGRDHYSELSFNLPNTSYLYLIVALLPFTVYSMFHTLGYTRQTILPILNPNISTELEAYRRAGSSVSLSTTAKASQFISTFVSAYYSRVLSFVCTWEVAVVMPWCVFFALLFRISLLVPIFYFQFLRIRYVTSPSTRTAFTNVKAFLDKYLLPGNASPSIPPSVTRAYVMACDFISRFGQAPQTQPQQ